VIAFEESAFRFEFGDAWRHVKRWDTQPAFLNGIQGVNGILDGRAEGTKAVDFVGVRTDDVWLFEVKDFRNRPAQWQKRIDELPLEMALKARDTIAGIVGARQAVTNGIKMQNDVLMKQLRQKLKWLTRRVYIVDPMLPSEVAKLPEIVIASLAQ
jgi:hypothetical protein